jgi:hypothetical protein
MPALDRFKGLQETFTLSLDLLQFRQAPSQVGHPHIAGSLGDGRQSSQNARGFLREIPSELFGHEERSAVLLGVDERSST